MANKAKGRTDGKEVTAVIDRDAQISIVTLAYCQKCGFPIKPWGTLLNTEGSGLQNVPYQGCTEFNLQIQDMTNFNEDVLVCEIKKIILNMEKGPPTG